MKHICVSMIFGLLVVYATNAQAMRCQNRIISRGQSAYIVAQLCGYPEQIVRTVEYLSTRDRHSEHAIEIQVELWTYDFGPHRFMRELRFENGVLASIRTLSYGNRRCSAAAKPVAARQTWWVAVGTPAVVRRYCGRVRTGRNP